jgi:hypothetical protein
VLNYYFDEANTQMTGVVWFGPDAKSHCGLCHGGAMSSLMNDLCGHNMVPLKLQQVSHIYTEMLHLEKII